MPMPLGAVGITSFTQTASGPLKYEVSVALRKANATSYFRGGDALWVKLVIPTAPKGIGIDQFGPSDTQTSITVRR